MRIKSIYIPDFLILKDFNIEFNSNNNFGIIIGDNGSGKSTLLEVIAYIFGHLHKYFVLNDKTAEFINGYEIEFTSIIDSIEYDVFLQSKFVNQKTNTFKPTIKINGEELSISQIEKKFGGFEKFLPSRIGVYYAGEARFLRNLSEHFEKKFIAELIKKDNDYSLTPLKLPKERPFYYVKDKYLGIILLSLITKSDYNQSISNLLRELIGDFDINNLIVRIVLKKPIWANGENDSLWGIKSRFVEQFITKLNDTSSSVTNTDDGFNIIYSYYGRIDLIALFNDSDDLDFPFMILDTLFYNGILDKVELTFKLNDGSEIESERLSEGQRQFIVTSGLSVLWNDRKNKLFLFDEPDVFLHPKWQREFLPFLKTYFKDSFALFTTHNPALLSDVNRDQVFVFRNGKVIHKSLNTRGEKFDRLLVDYFGLENTRSKEASNLFKTLYDQIRAGTGNSESFKKEFEKLQKMVGKDDKDFLLLNFELRKANEKN